MDFSQKLTPVPFNLNKNYGVKFSGVKQNKFLKINLLLIVVQDK